MRGRLLLFGLLVCCLAWGAQEATECDLDAESCTFTITLNIAFDSGADADYRATAANEIQDFWNNAGGDPPTTGDCKCTVKFVVNTKSVNDCDKEASAEWHCIKVTPYATTPPKDTKGEKYLGYMYPPGISTGGNLTGWWSDQMSRPAPGGGNYLDFAHEAGHLMGLEDGDGGIMSVTSGANARQTQAHIDEIIRDTCDGKECPDRCCCGNGKVDKDKGEGCDPVANPNGCDAGSFCCPYCCQCEAPKCDPTEGEYASKADCDKDCKPENPGETVQCVYNYYTGCWFCIPTGWESMYPETDPTNIRGCGACSHANATPAVPPVKPNTTVAEENVKKASEKISASPMLSGVMGDETINFYVEGLGEYHAVLKKGKIREYGEGLLPNPSMNMYSDALTVEMLANDDITPVEALKRELVTYEGVGFVEGMKFWLSDFLFDTFVPYDGAAPGESPEHVMGTDLDCASGECEPVDSGAEEWAAPVTDDEPGCTEDLCEPGYAPEPFEEEPLT
ncbi:MAG: hypothetical protein GY852_08880 [bacterium]|nr:hypothetical protein [bacterium]